MKSILVNPNFEPKNICPNCFEPMNSTKVGEADYFVCKPCNAGFMFSENNRLKSETVYNEPD